MNWLRQMFGVCWWCIKKHFGECEWRVHNGKFFPTCRDYKEYDSGEVLSYCFSFTKKRKECPICDRRVKVRK